MCHTWWILEAKIRHFHCCRASFQLSYYIRKHNGALNAIELAQCKIPAAVLSAVAYYTIHWSSRVDEIDGGVSHNFTVFISEYMTT